MFKIAVTLVFITWVLPSFGQVGIKVSLKYPNDTCFRALTLLDLKAGSSIKCNDLEDFKKKGDWNQAAGYQYGDNIYFNYFAILKSQDFTPISDGTFRLMTESDTVKNRIGTTWLDTGKFLGNNRIWVNGKKLLLDKNLPIWVVQSESNYYHQISERLNYHDLLRYAREKTAPKFETLILEGLKGKILEGEIGVCNNKGNFNYNLMCTIQWSNEKPSISFDSLNNPFCDPITNWMKSWQNKNGFYAKSIETKNKDIPISTVLNFTFKANKTDSEKKMKYKWAGKNWDNIIPETKKEVLKNIEAEYKIPSKCFLSYNNSSVSLAVDDSSRTMQLPINISGVSPVKLLYPRDITVLLGLSHTNVFKKNEYNKSLPWITIGSAAAIGFSFTMRNLLYQHYLKAPNERAASYAWSNGFNKAAVLSMIPYTLGVTLDLNKTIHGRKKLNEELIKLIGDN